MSPRVVSALKRALGVRSPSREWERWEREWFRRTRGMSPEGALADLFARLCGVRGGR